MDTLRKTATKVKNALKAPDGYSFDMSTKAAREYQVRLDFERATMAKVPIVKKVKEMDNYYHGKHFTKEQVDELTTKLGLTMSPPILPDPYIQVESQIDELVPTLQVKGREGLDDLLAKEREDVINFVLYNNSIDYLNLENERAFKIGGDAFYSVLWDHSIECRGPGGKPLKGDIILNNPDFSYIFPDPSAKDIDECEFICVAFRMHRKMARRTFGAAIDKINEDGDHYRTEIYEDRYDLKIGDETVMGIMYFYKDMVGDIAMSITVDDVEVRHVPKYWEKTRHSGNKMYPIVKYSNIPVRQSFWGKGEIEPIKDLVDAANRELIQSLLNNMFMNNDVVIADEGAMVEGQTWDNSPGAINYVMPGKSVRRLGGVTNVNTSLQTIKFIHEKIEETNGNYVSSYGKEPARVVTASGIAQMNERAEKRMGKKGYGRLMGYKRLFELIDWTALEFYDDDRLIVIRGDKHHEDRQLIYNSDTMRQANIMPLGDMEDGKEPTYYYPKIDIEVHVGEGIKKSKAFTLAVTQELSGMQITPQNAPLVKMVVELLELPNERLILEEIDKVVQQQAQMMQAEQQAAMAGAAPAGPGGPPPQGGGPEQMIQEILSTLSPEEQQAFAQLPPEQQEEFLMAAISGQPQ